MSDTQVDPPSLSRHLLRSPQREVEGLVFAPPEQHLQNTKTFESVRIEHQLETIWMVRSPASIFNSEGSPCKLCGIPCSKALQHCLHFSWSFIHPFVCFMLAWVPKFEASSNDKKKWTSTKMVSASLKTQHENPGLEYN